MNARKPEISVLIAIHNGEATLDRCFESLRKQTLPDFSIVCIDDASTDTTPTMLEKWKLIFGDDRMFVINNKENLGLTKSLNQGLGRIHTKYTARIDADDWWDRSKLERQLTFLWSHSDCGAIGCSYVNIAYGKERVVSPPETDDAIRKNIFRRNPFAHSAVIFDTALVKGIGGYDDRIRYGQDYDLWLRLLPLTKFTNLPDTLCFRNADSGISYRKQSAQMRQCVQTQLRYLRLYRRPLSEYRFILDPLLVMVTPSFIRTWKRKWL